MDIFAQFKAYIYGAFGVFLLGLFITIGVQHYEIRHKNTEIAQLNFKLETSNNSITRLTKSLTDINTELTNKAKKDAEKQADVATKLRVIDAQNQSLKTLSDKLRDRKATTSCPIPKDLSDAWSNL